MFLTDAALDSIGLAGAVRGAGYPPASSRQRLDPGVALLALGYLLWAGNTWLGADAIQGGKALLLALLLTVPGYVLGRMGGGDVKLLAALGLASDPLHLLGTFIGAALASGLWWLLAPRLLPAADQPLAKSLRHLDPRQGQTYAFAPFVLIGMALTLLWTR